ncbi:hypothetical protein [Vibrio sp. WXL210]|uniref:hypothetical protein n=1 Tax=Vibrio sp. WXL210 TaxID=3450709 RepID=UPI003EC94D40
MNRIKRVCRHAAAVTTLSITSMLIGCAGSHEVSTDTNACQLMDGSLAPSWYCDQTLAGFSDIQFINAVQESRPNMPRPMQEQLLLEQARLNFNQLVSSQTREIREVTRGMRDIDYTMETGFKSVATSESTLSQVRLYRTTIDGDGTMYGLAGIPKSVFLKAMSASEPQR